MNDLNREDYRRSIGTGGAKQRMEIITHGKKRFEVHADEPALEGQPISSTPAAPARAGSGAFFFRDDGNGKSQFCVRFPSGAVQVLATEP